MIYLYMANGTEEVEALSVVDILRRAGLAVQTVGIGAKQIVSSHNVPILCDLAEEEAQIDEAEMIVLPGGMPGTKYLEASKTVQDAISYMVEKDRWIAAICAAPSILGHRGLLKGREATCYPGFEEALEGARIGEQMVCTDGKFVTGRGVGVAIDFALTLVCVLAGEARAAEIRASIQCPK